jgi:hypothetical protein
LLISKGSKFDDQSASRTGTDRDSHHDRRVSHRLREGETSSQRKRSSWRKNQKDGKHKIHTTGKKADVFAEVSNGKVTSVTAAGMQVKKVRSRQKLADTPPGITLASMQLAQADIYYYGYWVYDDLTDYYYWFPAEYVIVDSSWIDYVG